MKYTLKAWHHILVVSISYIIIHAVHFYYVSFTLLNSIFLSKVKALVVVGEYFCYDTYISVTHSGTAA